MAGREQSLLRAAHAHPGLTRAAAARMLNISTGAATEIVTRLTAAELLSERPAPPTGTRGRPTRELTAHPAGPLVLACAISNEHWRLDVVQLGGGSIATVAEDHAGAQPEPVLTAIGTAVARMRRRFGRRIRGLGISAPGTIRDGHLLDAVNLGWHSVDLREIWPTAELQVIGNDATLAAVAESRRGAIREARLAVHLHIDAGLGGAVIADGRVLAGAHGNAGEFGHMPFGDPALECPCGARGCWGPTVDGSELARLLNTSPPREPVTFARAVITRAQSGSNPESQALHSVAANLGRGIAGLVNAFDPDVVTLGGLADPILASAPTPLLAAYQRGLMSYRRDSAPPIVPATVGDNGPLIGAGEQAWDTLWPILEA
jgi:predicted NBD/HSP70 family sugar kinase